MKTFAWLVAAAMLAPGGSAPSGTPSFNVAPAQTSIALAEAKRRIEAHDLPGALVALDAVTLPSARTGDWYLLRVGILTELGRVPEAEAAADTGLAAYPQHVELMGARLTQLTATMRYGDAELLADRLVAAAPTRHWSYTLRAEVRYQTGNKAGALADLDSAIKLQPTLTAPRWRKIQLIEEDRDWQRALAETDALITAAPGEADPHSERAFLLSTLGRPEEAKAAIDRSLAIAPNAMAHLVRLSQGLSGDSAAQLADAEAAIAMQPQTVLPARALRRLTAVPGNADQLLKAYDRAVANAAPPGADPQAVAAARAAVVIAADRDTEALVLLDRDVAVHPQDPKPLTARCRYRARRHLELDAALNDCNAALALDGGFDQLDARGFLWLQRGEPAKAIADYSAAMREIGGLPELLYGRGLARRMLGDEAGATADTAAAEARDRGIAEDFLVSKPR